jgi:hypothetical protein
MTESEWQLSADPDRILQFLEGLLGAGSRRKLRLFEVACCFRHRKRMPNQQCVDAIAAAERFADGIIDIRALAVHQVETARARLIYH